MTSPQYQEVYYTHKMTDAKFTSLAKGDVAILCSIIVLDSLGRSMSTIKSNNTAYVCPIKNGDVSMYIYKVAGQGK